MTINDLLPLLHQSPTTVLAIMVWLEVRKIDAKMESMVERLAEIKAATQ